MPDKCHMPCHSATVLLGSSRKTDRQQARPHEASRAGKRICKAECWPGEGLSSRADGKPGQAGISPWGALGLEGSPCSSGPTVRADSRAKRGPERGLPVPRSQELGATPGQQLLPHSSTCLTHAHLLQTPAHVGLGSGPCPQVTSPDPGQRPALPAPPTALQPESRLSSQNQERPSQGPQAPRLQRWVCKQYSQNSVRGPF